jgi:hypothetical protein
MNYGPRYSSFIRDTKRIPRNLIRTNNIYRLISYEYANGETESRSGQRATLIFVFGIYKREVHALKLNTINPDILFRWLKRASSRKVTERMLLESDLPSLIQQSEETGKAFFTSRIKGNSIYKIEPRAYRTYKFFNIKDIEEVYFKADKLESIFGSPNREDEEEVQDENKQKVKDTITEISQKGKPNQTNQETSLDDFIDMTLDILNKE